MNLVYDAVSDSYITPEAVAAVVADSGYKACRQELYNVLAKYSRDDAVKALAKTLEDWKSA